MRHFFSRQTRQFFLLIVLLAFLPLFLVIVSRVVKLLSKADQAPANITIDYESDLGPMPFLWQSLAQGSEEKGRMLSGIVGDVRSLEPQYIRLDHIFDQYSLVKRNSAGRLEFDFSELDKTVNDILETGALPFFALSYMPSDLNGDVTGQPRNWSEWRNLIQATVEHYSGVNNKNLNNVYYEVWNEPDLFGRWKTYGDKNYLNLYRESVLGATAGRNVNNFKIGGPATTGMYESWLKELLAYCQDQNLKLDFISYHRYSADVTIFQNDYQKAQAVLNNFPQYSTLPILVTEWGSDSENHPWHDGNFDAIHTIAAVRQMLDRVLYAFSFEIKDGPGNAKFWGRWGLFTHDKFGVQKKPRFFGLKFLNNLKGTRVKIDGEGGYVTAYGARSGESLKVMVVNYDVNQRHEENVPITFTNLPQADYLLKTTPLFGKTKEEVLKNVTSSINKTEYFPAQSAVLFELIKLAPSYNFSLGYFNYPNNWGLNLSERSPFFTVSKSEYEFLPQGTISFFLKPFWETTEESDKNLFNIVLSDGKELALKKTTLGFNKRLEFGIFQNGKQQNTVSASMSDWIKGGWYYVAVVWDQSKLAIYLDGELKQVSEKKEEFGLSKELVFYNFNGVIDELRILNISSDNVPLPQGPFERDANTVFLRHFDRDINN